MEQNQKVEADLLILIRQFKAGLKSLFKPIRTIFYFTLKHILKLALFSVLGVVLTLSLFHFKKAYFSSTICLSHERLNNDFCKEMVHSLKLLVGNPNNEFDLSQKLHLSQEKVRLLKNIAYEPLSESLSKLYNDSVSVMLPFKVNVEVLDVSILDSLQIGIWNYLESNEYITVQKRIDTDLLKKREERLKEELSEIDSLKLVISKSIIPRSTGNGIILGEPVNPMLVYNTSNYLYKELMDIKKKQQLNNSFQIMVGFTKNLNPSGLGRIVYILAGLIFGYLVGSLFLLKKQIN